MSEKAGLFYVRGDWNDGSTDACAVIRAKRLADGVPTWTGPGVGPHPRHQMAVDDANGWVYYGGYFANPAFYKHNAATGASLGTVGFIGSTGSGMLGVDANGNVFANQTGGHYGSWNTAFAVRWGATNLGGGAPWFAIGPANDLFIADGAAVRRVNGATGAVPWSTPSAGNQGPLVDAAGNLYVVAPGGKVLSYTQNGAARWTAALSGNLVLGFLGSNDLLFVSQDGGPQLFALKQSDGATAWSHTFPANLSGMAPSLTKGGSLIVSAVDQRMYRLGSGYAYATAFWPRVLGDRFNSNKANTNPPMP